MNRRDFVAALVAAGAVCAGLNGCSKAEDGATEKAADGATEKGSDGATEKAVDGATEKATPQSTPTEDGDTLATPTATPRPATPAKAGKRRRKPTSENPAGDGNTIP